MVDSRLRLFSTRIHLFALQISLWFRISGYWTTVRNGQSSWRICQLVIQLMRHSTRGWCSYAKTRWLLLMRDPREFLKLYPLLIASSSFVDQYRYLNSLTSPLLRCFIQLQQRTKRSWLLTIHLSIALSFSSFLVLPYHFV